MGILTKLTDLFKREPIETIEQFEAFMNSRSAFLAQKCVVEYCRARSGLLWEKLFKEAAFKTALDYSNWYSFTIAYSFVAEMMEGIFSERCQVGREGLAAYLSDVGARTFASYDLPAGVDSDFWDKAREQLDNALAEALLRAPKQVKEIPKPRVKLIFESLPIHEDVRSYDYELIQNNIRINLCRIYDDFIADADLDALAAAIDRKAEK